MSGKSTEKTTVYVVHGYTASSSKNWFPWLKAELRKHDISAVVFDMPNSESPVVEEWDNHLVQQITECGENAIFVGHSLGCITSLRFLSNLFSKETAPEKIKGAVLVSGFLAEVSNLPELAAFTRQALDWKAIAERIENRVAITAVDDDIVATEHTKKLAEQLNAELIVLANGGHFIDRDGVTELPAVLAAIFKMVAAE